MKTKYCIWMPFDLRFCAGKDWRYDKCGARVEWWEHRAKVVREYVAPGLLNLADQDFELFVPFHAEHVKSGVAKPVMRAFRSVPNRVVIAENPMDTPQRSFLFSGTRLYSIAERYRNKCDWVVMLWLDSDDIYHRDVWKHVKAVRPEEGLAIGFDDGYVYDIRDGRLWGWLGGVGAPPPFFGYCWPNRVLGSYADMKGYAKQHGFCCVHHRLYRCTQQTWLPKGLFLGTMTGGNCTKDIHNAGNRHIHKHILQEYTGRRRAQILGGFAVAL